MHSSCNMHSSNPCLQLVEVSLLVNSSCFAHVFFAIASAFLIDRYSFLLWDPLSGRRLPVTRRFQAHARSLDTSLVGEINWSAMDVLGCATTDDEASTDTEAGLRFNAQLFLLLPGSCVMCIPLLVLSTRVIHSCSLDVASQHTLRLLHSGLERQYALASLSHVTRSLECGPACLQAPWVRLCLP